MVYLFGYHSMLFGCTCRTMAAGSLFVYLAVHCLLFLFLTTTMVAAYHNIARRYNESMSSIFPLHCITIT